MLCDAGRLATKNRLIYNAPTPAAQLGLTVTSQTSDADEYTFKNVLSVVVDTSSSSHVYEGAIFGKDSPRLITVCTL
jgi:hypothetical protein